MARRDTPEPWKTLMEQKGIASPRQLSIKSGVSQPAIGRLIRGEGRAEDDTISGVADALNLDLPTVYALAGRPSPEAEKYLPPAEANRLTRRQRKAIDELIRATVADQEAEAGEQGADSAPSMNNIRSIEETQKRARKTPPSEIEQRAADKDD